MQASDLVLGDIPNAGKQLNRNANAGLLMLCWKTGKSLPTDNLTKLYGSFFNETQLLRMQQFATIFPDEETIIKLKAYIDWWHMSLLVQVPDKLNYYLKRTITEGLSSQQLEKEIVNSANSSHDLANYVLPDLSFNPERANGVPVEDLFGGPWADTYKNWLSQKPDADDNSPMAEFQRTQSTLFNKHTNIGINKWGSYLQQGKQPLSAISSILQEKYGRDVFSVSDLENMILLHKKFSVPGVGMINELVTWEQLSVLLQLDDLEEILFYSRLLALNRITLDAIGRYMSDSIKQEYQDFQDYRRSLPPPEEKEKITRKGNNTIIIKTIYVKAEEGFENGRFYFDVFKNLYFLIFAGIRF